MVSKISWGWIVLALAGVAGAQTAINEIRPAAMDVAVEISNVSGSIQVTAWDQASVEITGTLGKGSERLDVAGTEKRLTIKVVLPKNGRNVKGTQLLIRVPTGAEVEASGVGAEITTKGVGGPLNLQTVRGDILAVGVTSRVKAETVSGHVNIEGRSADVEAKAVSGEVTLRTATGRAEVSSVSGGITVEGEGIKQLDCATVTGPLNYTGSVAPGGTINLSTHSGSVSVTLPETTEAEFELSTFSGKLSCAFGGEVSKPGFGPGHSLEFTSGSGAARVRGSAFSGGITVSKQ